MEAEIGTCPEWVNESRKTEWLIIENAEGHLEDMGYVEVQFCMPLMEVGKSFDEQFKHKLRWRKLDHSAGHSAIFGPEDKDESGTYREPYVVNDTEGKVIEKRYLGPFAHQKAREYGLLKS